MEAQPAKRSEWRNKPRTSKQAWFLVDESNPSKAIYDMILEMSHRVRFITHKELWMKYAAYIYLSGSRRSEPLLKSVTIKKFRDVDGEIYIKLVKINEKHFSKEKRYRSTVTQIFRYRNKAIPINNDYEASLWKFLLGDNEQVTLDFRPLLQSRSSHKLHSKRRKQWEEFDQEKYTGRNQTISALGAQLSSRFSDLFRLDLTNGRKTIKNCSVPIHTLRHLRSYCLSISYGLPESLVLRLMGWDRRAMLEHYINIKDSMREREMLQIYRNIKPAS